MTAPFHNYKDRNIVQGLPCNLAFEIRDHTLVPVDLSGKTLAIQVFDSTQMPVVSKTFSSTSTTGRAMVPLSSAETSVLPTGNSYYRILMGTSTSDLEIVYKGYLTSDTPDWGVTTSTGLGSGGTGGLTGNGANVTVLPDGTLYPLGPITLQENTWYAFGSFYHFTVSGEGSFTMDCKDLAGGLYGNWATYAGASVDPVDWRPELAGKTSFRINYVTGASNLVVKYLP